MIATIGPLLLVVAKIIRVIIIYMRDKLASFVKVFFVDEE
jgi:hypothetical protein